MIGVTPIGLEKMSAEAGLSVQTIHPGYWKERPGLFFQDVVVLEKAGHRVPRSEGDRA
jgi:hypothetical protein